MSASSRRLRFADFTLDLNTGELARGGVPIVLQRKSFEVLAALVARAGELVTREELRRALWPDDVVVEFDNNLNSAVNRLRRGLGDAADAPRFIETLPGRGYRFVAPVAELEDRVTITRLPRAAASRTRAVAAGLAIVAVAAAVEFWNDEWRDRKRVQVAVVGFENVSGDRLQDHIGKAIAEQLRVAVGAGDGAVQVVVPAAREEAGMSARALTADADYILSGSANNAADGLHVTALLIDAHTNQRVWGAAYTCPRRDLAAIERQLAAKISGLVTSRLDWSEPN